MKATIILAGFVLMVLIQFFFSCKKDIIDIEINKPPVADAGPNQSIILPYDIGTLDGSLSYDPEGRLLSFQWTKIEGPDAFTIVNPVVSKTIVKGLLKGSYKFQLIVTDQEGLFAQDTVIIRVESAVQPIANAGPDLMITLPLDSAYIGRYVYSDPFETFQWSQLPGSPLIKIQKEAAFPDVQIIKLNNLRPGSYSFELKATNAIGYSTDTVNVIVIDDPSDPNTITFKNLEWHYADQYGDGFLGMYISESSQANLFSTWDNLRPVEIYLQLDPNSSWFLLPSVRSGVSYGFDVALPSVWVFRNPDEPTWVGKESNLKIKLL